MAWRPGWAGMWQCVDPQHAFSGWPSIRWGYWGPHSESVIQVYFHPITNEDNHIVAYEQVAQSLVLQRLCGTESRPRTAESETAGLCATCCSRS